MSERSARVRADDTSVYGPLFWASVVIGWALTGYGLWLVVSKPATTRPINFAAFFLGAALVHDLVLAPLALVAAGGLRRRLPGAATGIVIATVAVSAMIVVYAIPLLIAGPEASAGNPSLYPRPIGLGLLVVLAIVWAGGGVAVLRRHRRSHAKRGSS